MIDIYKLSNNLLEYIVRPALSKNFHIEEKNISANSDFGYGGGFDFENDENVDYIYVWSSGMLGYGLLNKRSEKEIISQEFIEINENDFNYHVRDFLQKIRSIYNPA